MKKNIVIMMTMLLLVLTLSCKTSQVRMSIYELRTNGKPISYGGWKVDDLKMGVLGTDEGLSITLTEGALPMIFMDTSTLKFSALDTKYINWHLGFFKGLDERAAYQVTNPDYEKVRALYQMIDEGHPSIPVDMRAKWMKIFRNAQSMELAVLLFNKELKDFGFTHFANLSNPSKMSIGVDDRILFVKFTKEELVFWIGTNDTYANKADATKALLLLTREQYK